MGEGKAIPYLALLGAMLLAWLMFTNTSCDSGGPDVKIYSSQPTQGGLVRKQANELIPYAQTENYICLNPSDAEALLNFCLGSANAKISPQDAHDKVTEVSKAGY